MLQAPARGRGCIATGSVFCTRLRCWTQGRARSRAPASEGAVKFRSLKDRSARARGRPCGPPTPGPGRGAYPTPTLRLGSAQTVGSQALRAAGVSGEGRPRAAVPVPLCPAGPRGCVDRAVRGWEEEETPGCALGPGPPAPGLEGVFLACAWRDIVSACLCPVCVYAEAPAAARVCTFCVRSELSREMSYMVWPQAPPGLSGGSSRSEGVRTQG